MLLFNRLEPGTEIVALGDGSVEIYGRWGCKRAGC